MKSRRLGASAAVLVLAGLAAAADVRLIPIGQVSVDGPATPLESPRAHDPPPRPADPAAGAGCGDPAATPVTDGRPMVVTLPPAPAFTVGSIGTTSWRDPPVTDPTWRLHYQGLMWMRPLARRAARDGQLRSLAALVDQAVAFHRQNPDPKGNRYGWDEGTALRRLATQNCLYALTRSAALIPGMTADAGVLLGSRYYGPPYEEVHNHGLMANLQLIRAADQLGRPAWKTTAIRRITTEAPQAFSALGFTREQASGYQMVNAYHWDQAATALAASSGTAAAVTGIRRSVARARTVFAWMTEPDGAVVQIGDTERIAGSSANPYPAPRVARDDQTGWIIGRWSWTDPRTTYYTVRYGPPRRAHGHHDRAGGVTFAARGVRVLVGPGKHSYDTTDPYHAYQISPQAHNVAIPRKAHPGTGAARVSASRVKVRTHAWTITDTVYGIRHSRDVEVNHPAARMRVTDRFPTTYRWRQHWHLDPAWRHAAGEPDATTLTFSHPSGRRLTVTTDGQMPTLRRGLTGPPAGWHFPRSGARVEANEIVIRANAASLTTTFTVS